MLVNGQIRGGDTYFFYTGSYSFRNGKWRGEIITCQHTEAVGKNLAFGGREVSCGFTGVYSNGQAEVEGTALVGKTSVSFGAVLKLQAPLCLLMSQTGSSPLSNATTVLPGTADRDLRYQPPLKPHAAGGTLRL